MKKVKLNKRDIVALFILACIVVGAFIYVLNKSIQENKFAIQMEKLYVKNENPIFSLDKIVLYSSANAIDNSEGKTLQDLNVYQFTDMAIYIDNLVDINGLIKESDAMNVSTVTTDDEASKKIKEHTIKELYIDNIKINASSNRGKKTLSYKSPQSFGKSTTTVPKVENNAEQGTQEQNSESANKSQEVLNVQEQPERIDFEVISTNVDNERSDYTKPTFYADCSNPITLNYMNKDIVTDYAVSTQNTQIKFDGSILQSLGVSLEDLACTVNFDIHMKNNLDQKFTCGVGIDIPLKNENRSIYGGYMYGMQNELQNKYKFFKN